jgi:hypothetical protein
MTCLGLPRLTLIGLAAAQHDRDNLAENDQFASSNREGCKKKKVKVFAIAYGLNGANPNSNHWVLGLFLISFVGYAIYRFFRPK